MSEINVNGGKQHKWYEICKDCYYGDNCITDEEKEELEQCDVFDELYRDGIEGSLYINQISEFDISNMSDIQEYRKEWEIYVSEFN
jgi:hypothetical protein